MYQLQVIHLEFEYEAIILVVPGTKWALFQPHSSRYVLFMPLSSITVQPFVFVRIQSDKLDYICLGRKFGCEDLYFNLNVVILRSSWGLFH